MSLADALRRASFASLFATLLNEVWISLHDGAPWPIWLLRLLPLAIFLPGMMADNLRSYIWLCFVCLLYFMVDVLRVFANPTHIPSILSLVFIVSLFCTAMCYVRWRARELREVQSDD